MQNKNFIGNLLNGMQKRATKIWQPNRKKSGLSWFKIKYLKHATTNQLRSYSYKNKEIFYKQPSEFLHTLIEIFENEIYKLNQMQAPYILDCGANIGLSVLYLKEKFPDATIIAFEPDEENFEILKKNVQSFNLSNVILKKEAVWIKDTTLAFKNDGTMGSKIDENESGAHVMVKASRLKNLLDRKIDFLKIDIEGAEYEVLKDITEDLHLVQNLFLEYHGSFADNHQLIEILTIIDAAGFIFYIKEAASIYEKPFYDYNREVRSYNVQLNIFCMRN